MVNLQGRKEMKDPTPFNEWFDISNRDHLKAYKHLLDEGEWPKHFIPADVQMEQPNWQQLLDHRIVKRYIEMMVVPAVRETPWRPDRPRPEFS
jgi:hypothetical protein